MSASIPEPNPPEPPLDVPPEDRARILARWYDHQFGDRRYRDLQLQVPETPAEKELRERWLGFLFDLLTAYLADPSPIYRDVYRGERHRCFDARTPPEERARYFKTVLSADVAALLERCDESRRGEIEARCRRLHQPLVRSDDQTEVTLLGVGDCLMTEIGHFLRTAARERGIGVDLRHAYFGARMPGREAGELLDGVFAPLEEGVELVALSFFTYEGLPQYRALAHAALSETAEVDLGHALSTVSDSLRHFVGAIRERSNATILLHNVSGVPGLAPLLGTESFAALTSMLDRLNGEIDRIVAAHENILLIDEREIAVTDGIPECSAPALPPEHFADPVFRPLLLARALSRRYLPILQSFVALRRAKVLAVDFDDTLWRGVMAEGPVEHHRERQALLRRLREGGMLLVAVSKNDPARIRWDEMSLERRDFVLERIGWTAKVDSIRDAARTLELGLDSFVFLDDRPEERGLVAEHLPSVVGLDSTASATWESLAHLLAFPNTASTGTAASRTEKYRARAERSAHLAEPAEAGRLLESMGIVVEAVVPSESDLDRVEELFLRTNQFNCTGDRHRKPALRRMLTDPRCTLRAFRLRDRFGDMGLVGVVVARRRGETDLVLSSVVMSCRAMGYGLEQCMIAHVTRSFPGLRYVGLFVPTERNGPAAGLFRELGFTASEEGSWVLGPEAAPLSIPQWLTLESP